MPQFPSELRYGSVLVYDKLQPNSKDFIINVKKDATKVTVVDGTTKKEPYREIASRAVAYAVQEEAWLAEYLNAETCLVPMPSSSLHLQGALWPTERLCQSLVALGLGNNVDSIVKRTLKVKKSAYCKPGEDRPEPLEHYNSVAVASKIIEGKSITLVDDVITRGSTTLGIYQKVAETYPKMKIRIFALARTATHIGGFYAPFHGTISCFLGKPSRD